MQCAADLVLLKKTKTNNDHEKVSLLDGWCQKVAMSIYLSVRIFLELDACVIFLQCLKQVSKNYM